MNKKAPRKGPKRSKSDASCLGELSPNFLKESPLLKELQVTQDKRSEGFKIVITNCAQESAGKEEGRSTPRSSQKQNKPEVMDLGYDLQEEQSQVDSDESEISQAQINLLPSPQELKDMMDQVPAYDKSVNYYKEFWRIYLKNEMIGTKLNKYLNEKNQILQQIVRIQEYYETSILNIDQNSILRHQSGRKRHIRRTAVEIDKSYECPYEKCVKLYGSQGSLNLHIKLKHNGGNKTEREKLSVGSQKQQKSLVCAKVNSSAWPTIDLNLPPGSIRKAAKQIGVRLAPSDLLELEQYSRLHAPGDNEDVE